VTSSAIAPQWFRSARAVSATRLQLSYAPAIVLMLCLSGMVIIQLVWTANFLRWPLEVMYGEALVQDHAARLLRGEALYQALGQPSFSVASYTPVFYLLLAASHALFGPNFLFGRVVAFGATVGIAAIVGRLAMGQNRGLVAGVLAALLFLALGFPNPFPWLAIGKEDPLAIFLSVASVSVLAGGQTRRRTLIAGALAALAILTKQTAIAALVAGSVALAVRNRRALPLFLAASVVPVVVVSAFFELTTHAFLANTVFANAVPFRKDILLTNLATLKAYQAGPLAVAAVGIARRALWRRTVEDVLLAAYGLAAVLPLIGLAAIGSAQNYWIELAAASALLAAAEIGHWLSQVEGRQRVAGVALSLLPFVNVVVAGQLALVWLPYLKHYAAPDVARDELSSVVETVRRTKGLVLAEPLDVLTLAGKPVLVEPFESDALYQSGMWDTQPVVDRICAGQIQLAVFAHSLDQEVVGYQHFGIWPRPMVRALRRMMRLHDTRAGRFVYVRSEEATCD
jgi:hypothetical protein